MSKRSREDSNMMDMEESLGPRSAKRRVLEMQDAERAKKEAAAQKRVVAKKLRGEVDDLAGLFGQMKASEHPENAMEMEGQGRRRRRRHTRKHKKSKKSKKTRKH
jgi:hypothetical protein